MPSEVSVLVLNADLLGSARIEAVADALGAKVTSTSTGSLEQDLGATNADVLIVDLDRGRREVLDALDAARSKSLLPAKVIAFVSHVDEDLATNARERDYETLPRGRFWRSLEELLRSS